MPFFKKTNPFLLRKRFIFGMLKVEKSGEFIPRRTKGGLA